MSKSKPKNKSCFRYGKPLFISFMKELEEQLYQNGQFKTSTSYRCAQISLRKYLQT